MMFLEKLSTEQRGAVSRAAHIYAEASGMTAAGALEKLGSEPGMIGVIATALREMVGVSPLADELDAIGKAETE